MQTVTIVGNPEKIKNVNEAEDYLSRIMAYEREKNCMAGILLIQRRQFDGLYEIVSEEEAKYELGKPITRDIPEFGVKYYPRTYFEALKERLSGKDVRLPELISRRSYRS